MESNTQPVEETRTRGVVTTVVEVGVVASPSAPRSEKRSELRTRRSPAQRNKVTLLFTRKWGCGAPRVLPLA